MGSELVDYYRCPEEAVAISTASDLSTDVGYFHFGEDVVCYGRSGTGFRSKHPGGELYDVIRDVRHDRSGTELPFDPAEVARNFRYERYTRTNRGLLSRWVSNALRDAYYRVRPLLPVAMRRPLQKIRLRHWQEMSFPKWPVDTSVDNLMERLLSLSIRANGGKSIPFIWFWPEGKSGCALMTHDVEEAAGVAFCPQLMDINSSFDIPAAFQIVPEKRYKVTADFLQEVRRRGFEVNVHDLNHDGQLYRDHAEFTRRAAKINQHGREMGAIGFRAGILYRNQEWFDELDFEYDSSVPNVAHLDPQHGGCCTVMPYFIGKMVELPVTTTQDYTLFHVLNTYGTELWERQIKIILEKHGLINVIVHPDYLTGAPERAMYSDLLGLLARLRRDQNVWIPLAGEANTWWRQRSQLKLVCKGEEWQIEGPNKDRAVIAYATLENDRLTYQLPNRHAGLNQSSPLHVPARAG